jgi:hypothetical protein
MDAMTCPSPTTFQSDKGKFAEGTSPYPPRGDLITFEDGHDHPDARMLSDLNDLDAVSRATPRGWTDQLVTALVPAAVATGPLVAKIEINLEADQNPSWTFSRDGDHYVDPRLPAYGIPYLGQPSVVYAVEFDPTRRAFSSAQFYAGYGELDGASGRLNPPDDSISETDGSGADRLQFYEKNGRAFRFGVFSHGPGGSPGDDDEGWGSCSTQTLPAMTGVTLEPLGFDRVRVHFTVPTIAGDSEVMSVRLYYRLGDMPLSDANAGSAIQQVPRVEDCGDLIVPGTTTYCDLNELFGSSNYQVGIRYEDNCSNSSALVAGSVTTPLQEFAKVDGLCFVATAAYGAVWEEHVATLRWFRDLFLKQSAFGWAAVALYYTHGPFLARLAASHELTRTIVQVHLEPMVLIARAVLAAR